jgi:hypothetical protein
MLKKRFSQVVAPALCGNPGLRRVAIETIKDNKTDAQDDKMICGHAPEPFATQRSEFQACAAIEHDH